MSVIAASYPGVIGRTRGALGVGFRLERGRLCFGVLGAQLLERGFLLRDLFGEPVGGRATPAGVRASRIAFTSQSRRFGARGSARLAGRIAATTVQGGHRRDPAEAHVTRGGRQLLERSGGQ